MGLSLGQWERVKELYEAAQTWSGEERPSRLDREPDALVRAEVLRLLNEQQKLGSFLSTPAFTRNAQDVPPERRMSPGQMLAGRFRILEFLAAGGMGEVYKAEDTRLDRLVALKFLPKKLAADSESLERLYREAKAASGLNHPNICTVYDFGEDGERAFIAMEYLEGETLSTRIKTGALGVEEAIKIALEIAGALSKAHEKNIVHRDLKPGNVILTAAGAKLLDFGLAKYERPVAVSDETVTMLTGEARVVGTLPYMSPEQLQGVEVDARGDIFAFGAVLYEMLTGKRAFERKLSSEMIAAVDREEPPAVQEVVAGVPESLEKIIRKCLRKKPEERYGNVAQIERELEGCRAEMEAPSGINLNVLLQRAKQPSVAISLVGLLVLVTGAILWGVDHSWKVRWAREKALPQIEQLLGDRKLAEAYALAVQAERYIPQDPILVKFWPDISWTDSIDTIPSGVSVYRRNYNAPDAKWEFVGRSPIEKRRFPAVDSNWRFELKGYKTVERATFPDFLFSPAVITMDEEHSVPEGMVRVDTHGKSHKWGLAGLIGFEASPQVPLSNYWIDKFEVTNVQFKRFVDQGGYKKQEYWKHEFHNDGRLLSWDEAMKLFQDSTGRPGPAAWVQGEFPRGQENYPVTGVSWYEAAAYAEFAGKELPTIYHWKVAALPVFGASMIPASNFDGRGPAPVGTYRGMSWTGTLDMAGNVKEWVLNDAGSGKRYILGGGWNEPQYVFNDPDARSPFQRSPNFGFRCAKYELTGEEAKAAESVTALRRDYDSEKPVSDRVFQVYRSLFSYDKTPLNAVVESSQQTKDWTLQKITFDAAYGNERMIAYLFLPLNTHPPYQTVVHFPGSSAVNTRSSADSLSDYVGAFDFIIKSGRAVIFPLYKGTFERGATPDSTVWPNTTISYRDHVVAWSKDLGRSIDYLETRQDIDPNRMAYEGYSWGATLGALLPAVEDRFKALVLICPGFQLQKQLPEVDQLNFAPRVKAPVLMLNGRYDFIFPVGSSQEPMFRLLGTPKEHKRRVVYDTGHDIPETEMIKETLNWLDRYLGRVK